MAAVLLIGTLNRVMIVELAVPASLVAVMVSLPLVFAPFRALAEPLADMVRPMRYPEIYPPDPEGYHPVVAAHGYNVYYLNALAGSARSMAATTARSPGRKKAAE